MVQPDHPMPGGVAPAKGTGTCAAALAPTISPPNQHGSRRRIGSEQIFLGSDEVEIDHVGSLYRLRITSLGKLILTK